MSSYTYQLFASYLSIDAIIKAMVAFVYNQQFYSQEPQLNKSYKAIIMTKQCNSSSSVFWKF